MYRFLRIFLLRLSFVVRIGGNGQGAVFQVQRLLYSFDKYIIIIIFRLLCQIATEAVAEENFTTSFELHSYSYFWFVIFIQSVIEYFTLPFSITSAFLGAHLHVNRFARMSCYSR